MERPTHHCPLGDDHGVLPNSSDEVGEVDIYAVVEGEFLPQAFSDDNEEEEKDEEEDEEEDKEEQEEEEEEEEAPMLVMDRQLMHFGLEAAMLFLAEQDHEEEEDEEEEDEEEEDEEEEDEEEQDFKDSGYDSMSVCDSLSGDEWMDWVAPNEEEQHEDFLQFVLLQSPPLSSHVDFPEEAPTPVPQTSGLSTKRSRQEDDTGQVSRQEDDTGQVSRKRQRDGEDDHVDTAPSTSGLGPSFTKRTREEDYRNSAPSTSGLAPPTFRRYLQQAEDSDSD